MGFWSVWCDCDCDHDCRPSHPLSPIAMLEASPFYPRADYHFRSTSSSLNLIFRTRRTRTRFAYDPSPVTVLSMLTLASSAVGHLLHASEQDVVVAVVVRRSLVHHHRWQRHHDHCQHHHGTEGSHPLGLGRGSERSRFPRRDSRRSGNERSDRHMERFCSRRAYARSIRVTWGLGMLALPGPSFSFSSSIAIQKSTQPRLRATNTVKFILSVRLVHICSIRDSDHHRSEFHEAYPSPATSGRTKARPRWSVSW
ncbi:hypothetical protein BKA70DRAFT_600219 [Coprinopsis sp. MPI-PUGE-AT-0042]|nr:hypothetical protein BKA70DRAFT_600219 [Coprinopsis sp. MPI-PUGE-AT-0042]